MQKQREAAVRGQGVQSREELQVGSQEQRELQEEAQVQSGEGRGAGLLEFPSPRVPWDA